MRARLPTQDIVYLADQRHAPYGDRTHAELRGLLAANIASLEEAGVDAIVMGCNTSCSIAACYGWPEHRVPVLDLIAAAAEAVARSGAKRIAVLATTATAGSGAYGDAIRRLVPQARVEEVAAPALVPLVEAGKLDGEEPRAAVAAACAYFAAPFDAIVLACTHYPLLDAHFAAVLGQRSARIDPAVAQSERTAAYVATRSGNHTNGHARGQTRYLTSGPLDHFKSGLAQILGPLLPNDDIAQVPYATPNAVPNTL